MILHSEFESIQKTVKVTRKFSSMFQCSIDESLLLNRLSLFVFNSSSTKCKKKQSVHTILHN